MTDKLFQYERNLTKAVLEIIAHHQPVPTEDIWYELGEDDKFENSIALTEVKDILSRLENERRIFKVDADRWSKRRTAFEQIHKEVK